MLALANAESTEAVHDPSAAPKLIDTMPGPMALARLTAPSRLLIDASGASIRTMRARGAVAWAHCTSRAISVAQPESYAGGVEVRPPALVE